jgi:hypothetical protein
VDKSKHWKWLKAAMNAAGIELAKAINYNDVATNDYLKFLFCELVDRL